MPANSLTAGEWREFSTGAKNFFALKPWEFMYDDQVFAIRDPGTGEMGYGCIMGHMGEVLGLALYRGDHGFRILLDLHESDEFEPSLDFQCCQDCLLITLEGRTSLDREDKAILKRMDWKEGKGPCHPQFRSMRPGFVPTHPSPQEFQYLGLVFEAACSFATRAKEDEEFGVFDDKRGILHFEVMSTQPLTLTEAWKKPDVLPVPLPRPLQIPEELVPANLEAKRDPFCMEIDLPYFPIPIGETCPPFFPKILLIANAKSELILASQMFSPDQTYEAVGKGILDCLLRNISLPKEIQVCRPELEAFLVDLCKKLKIKLVLKKKLKTLPKVYEYLLFQKMGN